MSAVGLAGEIFAEVPDDRGAHEPPKISVAPPLDEPDERQDMDDLDQVDIGAGWRRLVAACGVPILIKFAVLRRSNGARRSSIVSPYD